MMRLTVCLALALIGCAHENRPAASAAATESAARPEATGTPPAAHEHSMAAPASAAPRLDDLGNHHRAVTANAAAQGWFDQGLRLVYAFNHDEAQRAFEAGAAADPNCAMCSWGVALVLGPNYNLPAMPDRAKAAWTAIGEAKKRAPHATAVEQALIAALEKRYADPPAATAAEQAKIDGAYADAMRAVAHQFPDDDDVQVLFAEAMMDLRPWKLWEPDGKPAPGTEELVATLDKVLARNPQHPGANHYYIHALEASPHPEKALAAAKRVGGMMPGAGHLVHMPSHVYERVGQYEDAAEANRQAIAADKKYVEKAHPQGFYGMYVAHNFDFLFASAMMAGRGDEAVKAARDMMASLPIEMFKSMPGFDFIVPSAALALVRFGRWQEALDEKAPPKDLPLAVMLDSYARTRALTGLGKLDDADKQLATLADQVKALPKELMADMAPAPLMGSVAESLARGELLLKRGKTKEGLAALQKAVDEGDKLPYAEPPDWYYPPRHTLGARLVTLKKYAEAEKVYRADLQKNPNNGWSLVGLRACLKAQKKPTGDVDAQIAAAFKTAEKPIAASDF
jgi:tetratricopeptide (TPR) repeat protein